MTVISYDGKFFKIKGHSGYGTKGNDIVCSSISSMTICTLNAIYKMNNNAITSKTDDCLLEVQIKEHDKVIDVLLDNLLDMLKELEEQFPKNVRIENGRTKNE